jgi:hypothetical protein
MTIEGGTAIVLVYVLVSTGVIIAFWLAALVVGWFIGRLRQHGSEQRGETELPGRALTATYQAARSITDARPRSGEISK